MVIVKPFVLRGESLPNHAQFDSVQGFHQLLTLGGDHLNEKSILRILVAVCGNRIHGAYIFPVSFELP